MRDVDLREDETVPPSAVVLRFSPVGAARILEHAQNNHSEYGSDEDLRYFSSVWVDVEASDPADEQVQQRLLTAADAAQIHPAGNRFYFVCTAADIYELGLTFKKDRYNGEPRMHYSVDLGDDPDETGAERFASVFKRRKVTDVWPVK